MEIRDGFIVGIFNYCDRWCETCAFTSRCRLFADVARAEAACDPALKAAVDAPLLPQDEPPPPPQWLQELIEEANKAAEAPLSDEELAACCRKLTPEHDAVHERAMQYSVNVHHWVRKRHDDAERDPREPIAVISWFASLIAPKISRALTGLADDDPGARDYPADHDGSAKVALLGIERSHAAWLRLMDDQRAGVAEAQQFIADLVWLGARLEEIFPDARAFIRPAFDEADDVARLRAADRGEQVWPE